MAVKPNVGVEGLEGFGRNPSRRDFSHDEFVEQEAAGPKTLRLFPHFPGHQVGILIPERQDAGRLDAHHRDFFRHQVLQDGNIPYRKLPGKLKAALGDGRAPALDMTRNLHLISETVQEPCEHESKFRFLMVGEFVGEKPYLAAAAGSVAVLHANQGPHAPTAQGRDPPVGGEPDYLLDERG